jgi:hypothetical protein
MLKGQSDKRKGTPDMLEGRSDRRKGTPDMLEGRSDRRKGTPDMLEGRSDKRKGTSDMLEGHSENSEKDKASGGTIKPRPMERNRECVALHTLSDLRVCRFDRGFQRGEAALASRSEARTGQWG